MVNTLAPVTIEIDPESELARALEAVEQTPIILVSSGVRYAVNRAVDDRGNDHDPEAFRAVLHAAAGTFTSEERERLKERIYRGREEGTRPRNRR